MSKTGSSSIRVAEGDVLRVRVDPAVLCRVIEIGKGVDGGRDVVEIFAAGTTFEGTRRASVVDLRRVNKAALRREFERVGRISAAERAFSQFERLDLWSFLLTESVVAVARSLEKAPPKVQRALTAGRSAWRRKKR